MTNNRGQELIRRKGNDVKMTMKDSSDKEQQTDPEFLSKDDNEIELLKLRNEESWFKGCVFIFGNFFRAFADFLKVFKDNSKFVLYFCHHHITLTTPFVPLPKFIK
jgi:hypothetical protein